MLVIMIIVIIINPRRANITFQLCCIFVYKTIKLMCLNEARDTSAGCSSRTVEKFRHKNAQNIHDFQGWSYRILGQARIGAGLSLSADIAQKGGNCSGRMVGNKC